jgi:hypothetical protein
MSSIFMRLALLSSGYARRSKYIQSSYGFDPLEYIWPPMSFWSQVTFVKTWLDFLSSRYIIERSKDKKQYIPDYKPDPLLFRPILKMPPSPAQYLYKVETVFEKITDSMIPDEYIQFTPPSLQFCYRHVLSYLATEDIKLSINTINPLLVHAISRYSSGYSYSRSDKQPNKATLAFISSMLQHIEKDQALLKIVQDCEGDERKMTLMISNIEPLSSPSKEPIWDEEIYTLLVKKLKGLSALYDTNPTMV